MKSLHSDLNSFSSTTDTLGGRRLEWMLHAKQRGDSVLAGVVRLIVFQTHTVCTR